MLNPLRRGAVVLVTRDPGIEATVGAVLADFAPQVPRLTTVDTMNDCVTAIRLLDPSVVVLDDGVQDDPGPDLVQEVHRARPSAPVVYIASHHSLDLEREVRRRGVLFYIARPEGLDVLRSRLVSILQGLMRRTG
jgi:DNA-binding NarL/FixJ family response regulator